MSYDRATRKERLAQRGNSKNPEKEFGNSGKTESLLATPDEVKKLGEQLVGNDYYKRLDAAEKLKRIHDNGGNIEPARSALEKAKGDYSPEVRKTAKSILSPESCFSIRETDPNSPSRKIVIPIHMKKAPERRSLADEDVADELEKKFNELEKHLDGKKVAVEIIQEAGGDVDGEAFRVFTDATHSMVAGARNCSSVKTEYAFYQSHGAEKGTTLYFGKKFDDESQYSIISPYGNNRDGAAIKAGVKLIEGRKEEIKILINLSRGMPYDENYVYRGKDMIDAMDETKKKGIHFLHIAKHCRKSFEKTGGRLFATMESVYDIPEIMGKFLDEIKPPAKKEEKEIDVVGGLAGKLKSTEYHKRLYAALELRDLAKKGEDIGKSVDGLKNMRENDYTLECRNAAGEALDAYDENKPKNMDELYDPFVRYGGTCFTLEKGLMGDVYTKALVLSKIQKIASYGMDDADKETKVQILHSLDEIRRNEKLLSEFENKGLRGNIEIILHGLSNDPNSAVKSLARIIRNRM